MANPANLYQEIILDHSRAPRFRGPLGDASHEAEGYNPTCGDQVTVRARVVDGVFQSVHFEASGCALVNASASLMCETLQGQALDRFDELRVGVESLTTEPVDAHDFSALGNLAALGGVRAFPARRSCVLLPWQTMAKALKA